MYGRDRGKIQPMTKSVEPWEEKLEPIFEQMSQADISLNKPALIDFIKSLLKEQRQEIIGEVKKQLEMTILLNEKAILEDIIVDWPSNLRAFIKYLEKLEKQ